MPFFSETIPDWEKIRAYAKKGWIFRGQRDVGWDLETSLERCLKRQSIDVANRLYVERELLREFRRVYHQYATNPPVPKATLEWLSIMQHHGAPTRVLDFSYSIYVAAYFALEAADGDCAVWAVDAPWALSASADIVRKSGAKGENVDTILRTLVEEDEGRLHDLFFGESQIPVVVPVTPFRLNERLRIQKGTFLIAGSIEHSFLTNFSALPGYVSPTAVIKIIIPASLRRTALIALSQMNIGRTSLFPGLDGFAQSLGVYHPSFAPVAWVPSAAS